MDRKKQSDKMRGPRYEKWLFPSGETIGEALFSLIENEGDYFSVDSPFPETGLIRKNPEIMADHGTS